MSLFFAAIIIPLMFVLFSVTLDLSTYFAETQESQQALDDAATFAYRYLPYRDQAIGATRSYLARFGSLTDGAVINVDNDSLTISLTSQSPLHFARFFGVDTGIVRTAYTKVRGTPFDSYITVDRSSYMAPSVFGGTSWGDPTLWGSAEVFENELPISIDGHVIDPKIVTQHCFNPVFSTLKRAAIVTYDYLASFNGNRVGVSFFPGGSSDTGTIRELNLGGKRPNEAEAWFFEKREGDFDPNEGGRTYLPDELPGEMLVLPKHCAAAAEREEVHTQYRFPDLNSEFQKDEPGRPSPMIEDIEHGGVFNEAYQPFLRAREAIWSRSTHFGERANISGILNDVYRRLFGSGIADSRGGLVNQVVRTGFIIAGDLPQEDGVPFNENGSGSLVNTRMRDEIDGMKSFLVFPNSPSLKIYYILPFTESNGLSSGSPQLRELADFFDEESKIEGVSDPRFEIRLITGDNPEELVKGVIGNLVLEKRTGVLSR